MSLRIVSNDFNIKSSCDNFFKESNFKLIKDYGWFIVIYIFKKNVNQTMF